LQEEGTPGRLQAKAKPPTKVVVEESDDEPDPDLDEEQVPEESKAYRIMKGKGVIKAYALPIPDRTWGDFKCATPKGLRACLPTGSPAHLLSLVSMSTLLPRA
jgi:hypothetical protein